MAGVSQMFDDGLDSDIFSRMLSRLPMLRRIVFTEFRELAPEGNNTLTSAKGCLATLWNLVDSTFPIPTLSRRSQCVSI